MKLLHKKSPSLTLKKKQFIFGDKYGQLGMTDVFPLVQTLNNSYF